MDPGGPMPHKQGFSNNPYSEKNQSNSSCSNLFCLRSILVMSFHLCLGLPRGLFLVALLVENFKALLSSSFLNTYPAYFNVVELISFTILGERYTLWSPLLQSLPHSSFSPLSVPNIRLGILFSNILSLCSSFNVKGCLY